MATAAAFSTHLHGWSRTRGGGPARSARRGTRCPRTSPAPRQCRRNCPRRMPPSSTTSQQASRARTQRQSPRVCCSSWTARCLPMRCRLPRLPPTHRNRASYACFLGCAPLLTVPLVPHAATSPSSSSLGAAVQQVGGDADGDDLQAAARHARRYHHLRRWCALWPRAGDPSRTHPSNASSRCILQTHPPNTTSERILRMQPPPHLLTCFLTCSALVASLSSACAACAAAAQASSCTSRLTRTARASGGCRARSPRATARPF